jgi:phosphatidylglycerol:prolipoprotein diacylglycerol transferase
MHPYLVLDGLRISTWGLFVFLGGASLLVSGRICARYRRLSPEDVDWSWPLLMAGGFLGAHLYYLLAVARWPFAPLSWTDLLNPFAGTAVQGGMLGGLAAAWAYSKVRGIGVLKLADALSPGGALAQGIARIGCFLGGCCFGKETSSFALLGLDRQPVQLYETALDLGLAFFLYRRLKKRAPAGRVFFSYVAGYGVIRFVLQFLRDDDASNLLFGLAHSQYLSAAMIVAALVLLVQSKEAKWQSF